MIERVKSHRRAVRDEAGKTTEIEYAVKAENIIDAGDLQEAVVVTEGGVALMVSTDGTLRRTTVATILSWIQDHISSAYDDAVAGGYSGTEAEFKVLMANAASKEWVIEKINAAINASQNKLVTIVAGGEPVNVTVEPFGSANPPTAYKLSYSGKANVNPVKIIPPSGYAFTGTANTFLPRLSFVDMVIDGTLTQEGTYEFQISTSNRGRDFSFKSGDGHDFAILVMEVA